MWSVAPLEMNEGNSLGARVQSAYTGCSAEKAQHATFNFFLEGNKALYDIHITRTWTFTEFDSHRRSIGIQEMVQEYVTPPFHTHFHCGHHGYGDQQNKQ